MEYQKKSVAVEGFEMYQVDTNGIVYAKNGKPLKYSINHNGYCIVNFYVNHKRKGFAIHTLIALTFIPNPDNLPEVNHKDGDKHNNCVNNLEWCTQAYNINYSIENIRKSAQKRCKKCICVETMEVFESPLEIANKFNVRYYKVTLCCRNKTEEINGLHFEYI